MYFGATSVYKRGEHVFIGGEIGDYIKRLAESSGRMLAVVRYNEIGSFCVVEFMSPVKDVFIDIMNLGNSLSNFTRAKAQELCQRIFKPITRKQVSHAAARADSDYHHMRQDMNDAENERYERIAMGE